MAGIEAVQELVGVRLDALAVRSRENSLLLGWLESNHFLCFPFTLPDIEVLKGS
jgi:hypothetical protein